MKSRGMKIHVIGQDDWALGTEYRLARECLSTFAEISGTSKEADYLHTVDVESTATRIYRGELHPHVPIVGAINNHPTRLIEWPGFVQVANRYMHLVPQSTIAAQDMQRLGLQYIDKSRIATDAESYFHIKDDDPELQSFRKSLGIPDHCYLIGLLQRDSEGRDLTVPKRQKGPDIFLGLMMLLKKRVGSRRFHILLGGPRRHWIRTALERERIPYTFVGKDIDGEDYPDNILDKATMCKLYNLLDLYTIPTRWEGAPRQIFDVLECGRKIISTPVGIAPDILPPANIFRSLAQGVDRIERDMNSGYLGSYVAPGRAKVAIDHSVQGVGKQWEKVYASIQDYDRRNCLEGFEGHATVKSPRSGLISKSWSFLNDKTRVGGLRKKLFPRSIGVIADSRKKKDVLTQLFSRLENEGIRPVWNGCYDQDLILVWGLSADVDKLKGKRIIAVIDGEICEAILSDDKENYLYLDQAEQTIVTRDVWFSRLNHAGLLPKNPVVVRFPPDPSVFRGNNTPERKSCDNVQCVVFSNPHNRWTDKLVQEITHVEGVSFTLINNFEADWNEKSDQYKVGVLHKHDFALVLSTIMRPGLIEELLACGLPCLYRESRSDIQAVVGMAGLALGSTDEFSESIVLMRDNSECFRAAISLPSLDEAALTMRDIIDTTHHHPG